MTLEHDDGPGLLDGRLRPLDPRWMDQERVGWRLFLYGLVPALVVANALWVKPGGWLLALFILGPWPLVECFVRLGMVYTRRAFARTAWRVSDELLEIRRGVWWRDVVTVPLSRVQHTDVTQGPVQRRFGLATLVVHTAGTQHATVTLEGMSKELAEAVRDHLLQQRGDDAV
jgi:membrane protein YdbS with pleckstrin-like domain